MREYVIDCTGCDSPRALHAALAEVLSFPEWYGGNLDALHDLLTAVTDDTVLTLKNFSTLSFFTGGFRRVLTDCGRENPRLHITLL